MALFAYASPRVPLTLKKEKNGIFLESEGMRLILAFGAGTLLGDAFLHLLPEVYGSERMGQGLVTKF